MKGESSMPAVESLSRPSTLPQEARGSFIPVEDIHRVTNVELPPEMAAFVFGGVQPFEIAKHDLWQTSAEVEAVRGLAGATAGAAVRGIEEVADMSEDVAQILIQHPARTAATVLTIGSLLAVGAACNVKTAAGGDSLRPGAATPVLIEPGGNPTPFVDQREQEASRNAAIGKATAEAATPPPAKPEPVVVKPGAVETAKAGETAKQPEILQDELAKSIESLINMVQNPDPAIVAQYRFPQGRIESNQRMILSGALDKNVPGLTFILEDTIRTKRDLPLAKKQLEKIFKNAILDHTVLPDDSDRVILPEEQKPLYDPTGVYFTKGAFDTFSAINKDLGLATVQVLYQFDGKTTGPQGK